MNEIQLLYHILGKNDEKHVKNKIRSAQKKKNVEKK